MNLAEVILAPNCCPSVDIRGKSRIDKGRFIDSMRLTKGRSVRIAVLLGMIVASSVVRSAHSEEPLQYERDIVPVLKRHCVKCHGPVKHEGQLNLASSSGLIRGGDSGASLVPHDIEASLLWQRVKSDEMPPENPLAAADKELIRKWIAAGTPGLKSGTETDAEHWAFKPLSQSVPAIPASQSANDVSVNPIDRFLLADLARDELSFLAQADRHTLIRRVSLDLTGLPPSPESIQEFLSDRQPDAYSRMVDRYLASPHFGERYGKLWLDAAGYADSNGYFNADTDRPLAYRYRDYVIRAFNADKPFNEFIREQIAGDEIAHVATRMGESVALSARSDPQRIIELLEATHFLRNGQDGTGESDGNPDEVRIDRYTVLETTMQNISTAVLGLTIQCAKCHDHKFEPLTQRDYYSFQAVLIPAFPPEDWKKPNERFVYAPRPGEHERWEAAVSETEQRVKQLQTDIARWVQANRPHGVILFSDGFDDPPETLANRWSNTAPGDDQPGGTAAVNVNSREAPAAIISDGSLQLIEGGTAGDKWLSTKQAFDWSPDVVGGSIQVTFDLVEHHVGTSAPAERIGYFIALHDYHNNSPVVGGNILIDGNPSAGTSVMLDYPGSQSKSLGTLGKTGYVPGRNYGVRITNLGDGKFELQQLVDWQVDEPALRLTEKDLPHGGFGFEFCCGRSFVVDNVIVESFSPNNGDDPLAVFLKELAAQRQPLDEAAKARTSLQSARPGKISWTSDVVDEPPVAHLFERGNLTTPGEVVEPAGFKALGEFPKQSTTTSADPAEKPERKTSGRRLAFADWLTVPDSKPASLMARVQANRLWQHHFGVGLVAVTDNFGLSGPLPTNRELVDWLAAEYVRSGWSTKQMVRLIVHCAAYRQHSQRSAAAAGDPTSLNAKADERWLRDPDARRLSRFPVRRLDAEAIRDGLLVSGQDFDDRMYGPYIPTTRTGNGETIVPEDNPGVRRRSIYLQQKRTQVHSLLQVFDAPSIVFNSTRRARSTMPLQSLSLLNSEFVVHRAQQLAKSLEQRETSDSDRLQQAFLQTTGRPPTADDIASTTKFLHDQTQEYATETHAAQRAWTDLCQMLLVENAALYVD